jgi:hypothetical protein
MVYLNRNILTMSNVSISNTSMTCIHDMAFEVGMNQSEEGGGKP